MSTDVPMSTELRTSLDAFAEAEYADAPVSTIDIDRARADGRRRVLAARLAPIGGGVAVVAACALVLNGLGGASPAGPGSGTGPAAGRQFTGTDPLTSVARFGWLPAGLVGGKTTTGGLYDNTVTARAKELVTTRDGSSTQRTLTLTEAAGEPRPKPFETKTPVHLAGSQNAFIISLPGDTASVPDDMTLAWQTASGSWYTLAGDAAVHGAPLQAELIRVAEAATVGDTAVPLPLHIQGLPEGATLVSAIMSDPVAVGVAGFQAELDYRLGGAGFSVLASPTGMKFPQPAGVSPSTLSAKETKYGTVTLPNLCEESNGLHVCVIKHRIAPGVPDPLAPIGGMRALLNRVTSLGTDPAGWTTHVVD